jgi:pre-rRNA-processing protein IPI1
VLPHAPTLLLFTTSAQSHIFPEIRVDAIHILNVLLDVIPGEVTSKGPSGHGDRVLQGYCGLLVGNTAKDETGKLVDSREAGC